MKKIQISNPKEIGKILDFLHDRFFNKESISFEHQSSTLEIKFEREKWEEKKIIKKKLFIKRWSIPIVESLLRIKFVDNYYIEDKANIGVYDFNEIKYDEKEGNITITSGFPFSINIKVKNFQIEIEDTDNIIKEKIYASLF